MTPTIKQLRAFMLVCRYGVITRAADEMFVTQPAVSILIQQLEEALGLRLFDRTSRSMRATDAAREILPTVERMLRDLESIRASVKELSGRERGQLRFAATPSISAAIIPALLAEYRTLYPNIEISIDDAAPDRLTASTLTGDVEFSIGTIGDKPEGITLQRLARDNLCAICRRDSPIASKRRLTWEDALRYPWIGIKTSNGIRGLIDETLFSIGARKAVEYEVSYMATALAMTQAGLGIAIFPGILLGSFPHRDLVAKKLEAPVVVRDINLIHRTDHSLSPAAESFIELWYKRIGKQAAA
jgi:LysR family transcriptional regulator, carnitine catabolism transcriptional activator